MWSCGPRGARAPSRTSYFSDPRVKLADMTGDGLTDIVLIDGGRVDYWPSLGHGRWGRRVTMGGQLAFPDALAYGGAGFDPKRLLLGDVDGDGLADLVYVESGRITVWLNQSGNRWSEPIVVHGTPPIADPDAVRLADMHGTGTSGILWTLRRTHVRGQHVQVPRSDRQREAVPVVRARQSRRRSHADRIYAVDSLQSSRRTTNPETRWRGRLPFPVQVVSRVEARDAISGGKLVSEYRYHQGAWDGTEREFRGFGVVEQLDTESFARDAAESFGSRRQP